MADPQNLYGMLPQPTPGGTVHSLQVNPLLRYLYNTGPGAPPPTTTTTTLPELGAAYAADQPGGGMPTGITLDPGTDALLSRHAQFMALRNLSHLLRGGSVMPGISDADAFPLIQQLWNQGTLYNWGGGGMGTRYPFSDPGGRVLGAFERYQDYLNAGNPVARPGDAPGILGTMP